MSGDQRSSTATVAIRTAGDTFGNVMRLSTGCSACGGIRGGVGVSLGDHDRGGFVMSWEDFEAAYVALKAARETDEFRFWYRDHIKRLGPGLLAADDADSTGAER